MHLPHLDYPSSLHSAKIGELAKRERSDSNWREAEHPKIGDVCLFRVGEHDAHVGLMVADGQFLHSNHAVGASTVERIDSHFWRPRVAGVFRWCALPRIAGRPSPVSTRTIDLALPEGLTVREMLAAANVPEIPGLRVLCGVDEIPRDRWDVVRLKAGRVLTVAAAPSGEGKSPTRIALSIAVLAASLAAPFALAGLGVAGLTTAAGGLTLGGSLVAAGVGLGGSLAVNALVKPPRSRLTDDAGPSISASITGSRNRATPFGVIPVVLGTHRLAPIYGAQPYTEVVGDDQYLRMLFVVGYGPLEISDLRIGETPIEDYEGVEIEIREGREGEASHEIYPGIVAEESLSVALTQAGGWVSRTSAVNADELSVDVTFPAGLLRVASDGERQTRTVGFELEYRPTGSAGPWQRVNQASPDHSRGLAYLFREPEVQFGGKGVTGFGGLIRWGLGFGAKPDYLPTDRSFSWEGFGSIYVTEPGVYEFGIDSSDAGEIEIGRTIVASWYGTHGTAGGATPNFAAHSGSIQLNRGFTQFRVRMEARSTQGAVAFGWKPPGGSWAVVPNNRMATSFTTNNLGGFLYRWYDTSVYDNSLVAASNRPEVIRVTKAWAVPRGQYDVRIRRVTADASPSDNVVDQSFWTALRTISAEDPIRKTGLYHRDAHQGDGPANGVVDDQRAGTLDRPRLGAVRPTVGGAGLDQPRRRVPARAHRACQPPPMPLDRIDLPRCSGGTSGAGSAATGITRCSTPRARSTSGWRASPRWAGGVRHGGRAVLGRGGRTQDRPVQHFTPRNSVTTSAGVRSRHPARPACAVPRRDADYQQNERIVYADGYDEDNATEFETLGTLGVTSGEEAPARSLLHRRASPPRDPRDHHRHRAPGLHARDLVLVTRRTAVGSAQRRVVGLQLTPTATSAGSCSTNAS